MGPDRTLNCGTQGYRIIGQGYLRGWMNGEAFAMGNESMLDIYIV